ncbi:MAG TPA: hypothetical protein VKA69_11425 [Desulfobacteria bacterium]|nr:hypothetical protein [Desulfobacteria bacterium]
MEQTGLIVLMAHAQGLILPFESATLRVICSDMDDRKYKPNFSAAKVSALSFGQKGRIANAS